MYEDSLGYINAPGNVYLNKYFPNNVQARITRDSPKLNIGVFDSQVSQPTFTPQATFMPQPTFMPAPTFMPESTFMPQFVTPYPNNL